MDMTKLYEEVRGAWLQAGRSIIDSKLIDGVTGIKVCPGVRNGVLGMHCVVLADTRNLWLDIAMSGQYVYQIAALQAIRAFTKAAQPFLGRNGQTTLGFMPNELVALALTDPTILAATGVRTGGPITVPATNLTTVWMAADDEWIMRMSDGEFEQLMLALDPWARSLVGFPFYAPEHHAGWLNFMIVPDKHVQELTDEDLAIVAKTSQPGWNFVNRDEGEYVWSLREVLSLLSEHGV